MLGISAIGLPPAREPGAPFGPPSVAECKSLFETAPVGLGADRKPEAGGACFKICVADRACHFPPSKHLGSFWGVCCRRKSVYHDGRWRQETSIKSVKALVVEIRQCSRIDPLKAETRVRFP